MEFLQKNIDAMPVIQKLYDKFCNELYPVEINSKNQISLKINNIYFHSKYNPEVEADRAMELLIPGNIDNIDVFILYGNGLGYILSRLYKKLIKENPAKIKPIIMVIESDIKIFLTGLKYFDFSEILQNENVKFFLDSDKEQIGSYLQSIPTKYIRYYYHRPSYNIYGEYYKDIQNYINYILDRKDMNSATFNRFQKLWTRNSIRNLPHLNRANSLKLLDNIAGDCPSFVIAGGPTLELCLDTIRQYNDTAVIIAVDTAYKYLISNNIKVDIIVTVDPQYWNYKYLENIKISDEIIVTDSSIYYKIFELTDKERYFIGNSIFPLNKFFEEDNDRGVLAAGGSVANTAFDIARIIGSKEIYLFGLDLSYPQRKTHFKGAFFESNFLTISDYFKPVEQSVYNYLAHCPLIEVDSTIDKQKVFSDQKMILFKKWFDREVGITNAIVYQPNLGGVSINDTKKIQLIDMKISNIDKSFFKKKIKEIIKKNSDLNLPLINVKIIDFLKHSKDIKKDYSQIVELISDNGEVSDKDIPLIQKIEEKVNNDIVRKKIASIISSSAQDVLIMIMENYTFDEDEKKSAWIKTKLLYKSIVELTDFYLKNFNKLLKITKNITNI